MLTDRYNEIVDKQRTTRIEDILARLEATRGVSMFSDRVIAKKGVQDLAKEDTSTSPQAEDIIARQNIATMQDMYPTADYGSQMDEVMSNGPSMPR